MSSRASLPVFIFSPDDASSINRVLHVEPGAHIAVQSPRHRLCPSALGSWTVRRLRFVGRGRMVRDDSDAAQGDRGLQRTQPRWSGFDDAGGGSCFVDQGQSHLRLLACASSSRVELALSMLTENRLDSAGSRTITSERLQTRCASDHERSRRSDLDEGKRAIESACLVSRRHLSLVFAPFFRASSLPAMDTPDFYPLHWSVPLLILLFPARTPIHHRVASFQVLDLRSKLRRLRQFLVQHLPRSGVGHRIRFPRLQRRLATQRSRNLDSARADPGVPPGR